MSTVIVTRWATSEAYQANQSICEDGWKLISDNEGVLLNQHGAAVSDPSVGISVQTGESPEAYKKVVTDTERFGAILEKLKPTRADDNVQQYHFIATSDPSVALAGPVTEVGYCTLISPTPESKKAVTAVFTEWNKTRKGKTVFGWTAENENLLIAVAQWDSVEQHVGASKLPGNTEAIKTLNEHSNIDGPYDMKMERVS